MLTGIASQKELEIFLTPLKPRQKIKIVFSNTSLSVVHRVVGLIHAGLLYAPPIVTATLSNVAWRGSWGSDSQTYEFELTNDFTQPDASRIVAEAIWFGVGSIEVVEG